jgi:hypothetical protein
MASSEQIYIVRVRAAGTGVVVEDVRRRERRHIADPSGLGPLLARWIERPPPAPSAATRAVPDLKEDAR